MQKYVECAIFDKMSAKKTNLSFLPPHSSQAPSSCHGQQCLRVAQVKKSGET
jgi:hypothetical protein